MSSDEWVFRKVDNSRLRFGQHNKNSMTVTIYVALVNEGTDVWRPVEAEKVAENTFRLLGSIPSDEDWRFRPGDLVHCEEKELSEGPCLVAATAANENL